MTINEPKLCTLSVLGMKRQLLYMWLVTYLDHVASAFSFQVLKEYTALAHLLSFYCHFYLLLSPNFTRFYSKWVMRKSDSDEAKKGKQQRKLIRKEAKKDRDCTIAEMKAMVCVYMYCYLTLCLMFNDCFVICVHVHVVFKSTFDNYSIYKLMPRCLQETSRSVKMVAWGKIELPQIKVLALFMSCVDFCISQTVQSGPHY